MWNLKRNMFKTENYTCLNCIPGTEITIGTQIWTGCNLNVSTYRNGTVIPQATTDADWVSKDANGIGAWCYYNNDPSNEAAYGKLYNWHAVNDSRGLAPTGYHVPSNAEWDALATNLGGLSIAGKKMKEIGQCHWDSNNNDSNASNESGFTGLGAGRRLYNGTFQDQLVFGMFWSSNDYTSLNAYFHFLFSANASLSALNATGRGNGFSIRLIKD